MTRRRILNAHGHESYLHCLTCNPPPAENPDRLQGPDIGTECIYRSKSFPDGVRVVVTARSYVWAPGDPSYHGGSRRYDWKVIRLLGPEKRPPFFGSPTLCVDDKDLSPIPNPVACDFTHAATCGGASGSCI